MIIESLNNFGEYLPKNLPVFGSVLGNAADNNFSAQIGLALGILTAATLTVGFVAGIRYLYNSVDKIPTRKNRKLKK